LDFGPNSRFPGLLLKKGILLYLLPKEVIGGYWINLLGLNQEEVFNLFLDFGQGRILKKFPKEGFKASFNPDFKPAKRFLLPKAKGRDFSHLIPPVLPTLALHWAAKNFGKQKGWPSIPRFIPFTGKGFPLP